MKKIFNYSVLLLSVTCLLTACASKMQESKSETATRKTTQASTKQTSSSKPASSQETTTEANSSAEASQQNQETQNSQAEESILSTETTHTQLLTLPATTIPDSLVGKWQGSSQQARNIEVTISADGTFTTYEDFRLSENEEGEHLIHTYTAKVTDLVEYAPNHYLIREAEGEYSALLPGMTGLGGRIAPGFILEGGQYKVVMWGNPADPAVEAKYNLVSEPNVFVTLDKVE
ncbi:hypothetical protein HPA88_04855 [Streptococcus suis]|uniref:Putative lipoprotein n=3 Tax=Streptococcus suis TaxID=1307 RepID=G7SEX7_STRSU|nr:hypothetical protein [Streptococcus suis]AER18538.1 putative lipoprotein [Streptococcus suis D12]ANC99181.1 hypothetical protein A6M16_01125 [Streptococcus suis]AOM73901.1 hypothetical protein BFP66_01015 [Streptococcus suis]MBL6515291.1 hypothetical protein [Streptococcus suis]MBS8058332.1 hypothetical protein [Streptococcus suis]